MRRCEHCGSLNGSGQQACQFCGRNLYEDAPNDSELSLEELDFEASVEYYEFLQGEDD